jgi:16S rRNA G966 N2-methylase RsmD
VPVLREAEEGAEVSADPQLALAAPLGTLEARRLTNEVKADAAALWSKLLRLYEGGAHAALGYSSWAAYCAAEFDMGKSRSYQVLDAARVVAALPESTTVEPPANEAQARELGPVMRDEGEQAVVEVWRDLRDEFGDLITAKRIRTVVRNRARRMQREHLPAAPPDSQLPALPADVDIRCCDIRELDVPDESVDLIFTDPPYLGSTLDEYDALADFAARALRPGAMLIAYCGNTHALDNANRLARRLEFVAFGGVYMPGSYNQVFKYKLRVRLKPLLFLSKGRYEPRGWWEQVLTSPKPTKDLHPWQQSEGDADRLIAALTEPGTLVCDPFLGSGTTAAVAHSLGRRFVGCDVDPNAVAVARQRLAGSDLEAVA